MHEPKKRSAAARSGVGLERWDDLRVFLAVLREGSFSAAARSLAIEQSTVSRRIAFLEQSLGAQLFDRLPEGPAPTLLAQRLREQGELIEAGLLDFGDIARGADKAIEGKVTLALTDSFAVHVIIPRMLGKLRALHPNLSLHLLGSDQSADLARREADLALRFYRPSSGDLVHKRLARLSVCALAHKRYAKSAPRDPAQVDWVTVSAPGLTSLEQHWSSTRAVGPRLTVSSHLAQVEAVRAGLGAALLTRSICQLDRNLVELPLGLSPLPPVELWLVAPRTLRQVPRVAAVWEVLEKSLAVLDDG